MRDGYCYKCMFFVFTNGDPCQILRRKDKLNELN